MSSKRMNRLDKIMKILTLQSGVSIKDFSKQLEVSEITVRRDLQYLEQQGRLRLINGVAIYRPAVEAAPVYPEYNLAYEYTVFKENKERIGRKAASLIEPNDVVAIDCGSTTEYLSRNLPPDIHMTVLTYSMNTLLELDKHPNYDVICSGGYLYPNTQMFYSPEGISLVKRTCINKAFLSAAGISNRLNVTCIAPHEMDAKSALMESSQSKILLADSSKFGKIFPTAFSLLTDFDIVITDNELSAEWQNILKSTGITFYLV
ncbi:DeoR/GlpR transcriptional regulator [Oscillibacter valericigenes]|nr:DeoR/GlpR transcriptional regulator [Oscillibacter valericigenes]